MTRRRRPDPYRSNAEPIGTVVVTIGFGPDAELVEAPLIAVTTLGEALVRLPDGDRYVPASWWAPA